MQRQSIDTNTRSGCNRFSSVIAGGKASFDAVHGDRQRSHSYTCSDIAVHSGPDVKTIDPWLTVGELRRVCQSGQYRDFVRRSPQAHLLRLPQEFLSRVRGDDPCDETILDRLRYVEASALAQLAGGRLPTVHEVHRLLRSARLAPSDTSPRRVWTCSPWWRFRLSYCIGTPEKPSAEATVIAWHQPTSWARPAGEPRPAPGLRSTETTLVDWTEGFDQIYGSSENSTETLASAWVVRSTDE